MEKYVDLTKILKEQQPLLYKKLPKFVIKIIEGIIRQRPLNKVIHKYIQYEGLDFTSQMIKELDITLIVEGEENLPENQRAFFVANHLYGIVDGMLFGNIVGKKYGTFMGISNDAFNLIPQLKNNITSVNVYGKSAKEQIMVLDKLYKSDLPINHFPAGEVSRNYKGKIEDKEWHKSVVTKAVAEKRDVVPVLFGGRNSRLFYAVYSIRRFFRIKANIELILLPSEMFKQRGKTIKTIIGKPIPYTKLVEGDFPPHIVAANLRAHLYSLKDDPNKVFDNMSFVKKN